MFNFYACMFRLFGVKNWGGGGHLAPPHATALVRISYPEFYFGL